MMDEKLINKTILCVGTKGATYPIGTKIVPCCRFIEELKCLKICHIICINSNAGKQFKLEVWEAIVKTMALNEVASFVVDKRLTAQYPFVAKTLRDVRKPKAEKRTHVCGATLHSDGVGYDDLNQLIAHPKSLEFTIEVIQVETPDEYEKEAWQMDESEKLEAVPTLRQEGNAFYRDKKYDKAAEKYCMAIGILEQLMLKEKPRDTEWNELNAQKLPLLLNYSQCQLLNQEYYAVIEHCTTVIDADPGNVKAYYRRAKAHMGAWNPDEAERDLEKVLELDSSLSSLVRKDLKELEAARREKTVQDFSKFNGKLF